MDSAPSSSFARPRSNHILTNNNKNNNNEDDDDVSKARTMSSVAYFDRLSALGDREDVPNSVRVSARTLVSAYRHFLKETAVHLAGSSDEGGLDAARELLEVCPEALRYEFEGEGLLIHSVSKPAYVTLYSEVGARHDVGGPDARGGLLDEDPYEDKCNKLQSVACDKVHGLDTLRALSRTSPPLFLKEDVRRFALVHRAAYSGNLPLAEFLLDVDPSSVAHEDEDGHLPVEESVTYGRADMFRFLLRRGAERRDDGGGERVPFGGLFREVDGRRTALEVAVENIGRTETLDCVESVLSSRRDDDPPPPVLHELLRRGRGRGRRRPSLLPELLARLPECIVARDGRDGRLPVHVALDEGLPWSLELVAMIGSASESVANEPDPVTGMFPFMLAAAGPRSCDLRTVYRLLRANPQHVLAASTTSPSPREGASRERARSDDDDDDDDDSEETVASRTKARNPFLENRRGH